MSDEKPNPMQEFTRALFGRREDQTPPPQRLTIPIKSQAEHDEAARLFATELFARADVD